MPTVLIITNFPILAATAKSAVQGECRVSAKTWTAYAQDPGHAADLVVVDVTAMVPSAALALVASALPQVRIAVCSLHRNEVEVYRIGAHGFAAEGAFPTLLALMESLTRSNDAHACSRAH